MGEKRIEVIRNGRVETKSGRKPYDGPALARLREWALHRPPISYGAMAGRLNADLTKYPPPRTAKRWSRQTIKNIVERLRDEIPF